MSSISSHSFVGSAGQDQRYVGLGGAEHLGYAGLGHRTTKFSNFSNFSHRQKLPVSGDKSCINSMLLIETIGRPFEIDSRAIGLHSVNVVDDRKVVWIGNEGQCHQSVNQKSLRLAVSEKGNLVVASTSSATARTQNLSVTSLRSEAPHSETIKTANSAKIADFVKISEMSDCNRSPFFRCSDIHSMGCPSGEDGLAIKDPSIASTFGGSAIMASTSITYNRRLPFPSH